MATETLYVRMFGGFTIHYGGKAVALNKAGSSKSVRLIQMLFLSPERRITKNELIDNLYGWNDEKVDSANRNKNLNNLIYRLRKRLIACGLPEDEYIELSERMCSFQSHVPLEVDTCRFEELVEKARRSVGEERIRLFYRANEMYRGELLPENLSDAWFFQKSNYFKELYICTVRELEKEYKKKEDYNKRLQLYARAALIYPFDNWQTRQIRCNLEIYRYEEALRIYNNTLELYNREIGSPSAAVAELQACFEREEAAGAGGQKGEESGRNWNIIDKAFAGKKNDIRNAILEDKDPQEAYYCTYPGFVDYCRLVERAKERTDFDAVLMFLTLSGTGKKNPRQINIPEQMQILKTVIGETLRKGDAYTRYGNRHFILMLVKAGKESCSAVFRRIEDAYMRRSGKGELWYLADMTQELGKTFCKMQKKII